MSAKRNGCCGGRNKKEPPLVMSEGSSGGREVVIEHRNRPLEEDSQRSLPVDDGRELANPWRLPGLEPGNALQLDALARPQSIGFGGLFSDASDGSPDLAQRIGLARSPDDEGNRYRDDIEHRPS